MHASEEDSLRLEQRLALSYSSARIRNAVMALMLLDNRIAGILRTQGEPMLSQIKLAWWRERLQEDPLSWPKGEPLLETLQRWVPKPAALAEMVDGWEHLLSDELTETTLAQFATLRARSWRAIFPEGYSEGVERAGRRWALADLCLNLGNEPEIEMVKQVWRRENFGMTKLPREFRSLSVMAALGDRAMRRGSAEILDGPAAMLVALRIGLLGR